MMAKTKSFNSRNCPNVYTFIGQRIRKRRETLGFSLNSLASQLNMEPALLADIEAGKLRIKAPVINALVDKLRTTRLYLITGLDEKSLEAKLAGLDRLVDLHGIFLSLSGKGRKMLKDIFKKMTDDGA